MNSTIRAIAFTAAALILAGCVTTQPSQEAEAYVAASYDPASNTWRMPRLPPAKQQQPTCRAWAAELERDIRGCSAIAAGDPNKMMACIAEVDRTRTPRKIKCRS